jgi:hypothetical protein
MRPRPCRIPLSAFIVEDMVELAHAHATYRFVILDEEEERPRILVRASRKFDPFVGPTDMFQQIGVALQTKHAPIISS